MLKESIIFILALTTAGVSALDLSGVCGPTRTPRQTQAATNGTSVIDLLCRRSEQSLILRAFVSLGMTDMLSDPNLEATVFAPKNSAIRSLLSALSMNFDQLLEDPELMEEILSYHVVPGATLMAKDLTHGLEMQTMLANHNLTVVLLKPKATLRLRTTLEQEAKIIKNNFSAGSAVVHVVSDVLLPAEEFGIPCTYIVQSGDTTQTVAMNFGLSEKAVKAANPDAPEPLYLMRGKPINLPCS